MNVRQLLRRNRYGFVTVMLVSFTAFSPVAAQRVVSDGIGSEYRSRGDTIWRLRDTTMTRAVYRADTVVQTRYVLGRATGSTISVVRGDSATTVARLGPSGEVLPGPGAPRTMSAILALSEQRMFEMAVRRESSMPQGFALPEAPVSPADVQRYPLSASTNIIQHGDTVWYVRGCVQEPPADTTTYLLFANDSLRRLSPSPRTFDKYMVTAVRSDMNRIALAQVVAARRPPVTDLPGVRKSPCDKR